MLSLLSYSDCTRPLWPQRRNLLSALYPASPAPYMPRSVLHTTPPHPNRRYPLPALTRCQTLHYALRLPRVAFQKHIWPFRFNGLKPLGHLSTYTGARLKRGQGNNSHTPNLKLRHSHDTKPRLRYCSQPYPALSQLLNIAAQPTMASCHPQQRTRLAERSTTTHSYPLSSFVEVAVVLHTVPR